MLATPERTRERPRSGPALPDGPSASNVALPIPLVDLKAQFAVIRHEVEPAMAAVLERCDFVLGETVQRFEESFARFCEAPHALGVDSGISALELILRAWGIGPGDEVITAANSFIASASAISFTGAAPVLVDV